MFLLDHLTVCKDFDDLLALLRTGRDENTRKIRGALVDQYFFASQQHYLDEDMLIEKLHGNPLNQGIVVQSLDENLTTCLQKEMEFIRDSSFQHLTTFITPLTVSCSLY